MSSANEYAEKIAKDFLKNITDHIFCHIQNNEALMREYQTQVHQNSLKSVNTAIGQKVKEIFELENAAGSDNPKSWLIKSFTQHKK